MNYTKGKWSVHELDRDSNSCPPPLAEMIPSPNDIKIQIVAWDAFNKVEPTEDDYEISRANAHLIAAAPDMHKELTESRNCLSLILERVTKLEEREAILEQIRRDNKALSKAEGREE